MPSIRPGRTGSTSTSWTEVRAEHLVRSCNRRCGAPLDREAAQRAPDDRRAQTLSGHFAEAGADHLLVQAEPSSTIHLHRVLSRIRELGKKAGTVLDPASPIAFVEQVLHLCDVVMVMTVNPGFGGQKFLADVAENPRAPAALRVERVGPRIDGDGGQNSENAALAIDAGSDAIVVGSGIFRSNYYAAAIARIRNSRPRLEGDRP
jgi:ribulose-phosphate 3-epimerase